MVTRVVLWRPRADLAAGDRQALLVAFETAIREIPSIRGVRIGRRVTHGAAYEDGVPDCAEYLAVIDFDDLAGLQAYLRHPAHEQLGALFNRSLSDGFVYDFEVGGPEELRAGRLFPL